MASSRPVVGATAAERCRRRCVGSDVERLVCAPRLWLIARRNCSLLYDPLSY